jgi:(R,R)-butanediol dehydrogenase / meso-butanediol dehydrogenase / diacetyl reductase
METMQALVFKKIGKIDLEEIPVPQIQEPTDVIIKVAACGICGSDIKILEGKHAFREGTVLGHEFCGTVVETGSAVRTLKVGDRIAIDNNPRCGVCDYCRMGFSSQCEWIKERTIGIFRNGGYAQYSMAPESVCYKLPASMDTITATQVETLGTVMNGMNTVQMQPWDSVLILGCGPIGFLFASLAKHIAADVMVSEIDAFRYAAAKQIGVQVFNPEKIDLEQAVKEHTAGKGVDIVIDAVGTQLGQALKYVTAGGKILAFGMDDSAQVTVTPYTITRRAIKILGTYIGQNTMLPSIKILQSGKLNLKPFFTETVALPQGLTAFPKLGLDLKTMQHIPKQAMKIVLQP